VTASLRIYCTLWTHNAERRGAMHWSERAEKTAAVRETAKIMALAEKVPKFGKVSSITATAFQHRGPLADPAGHAPTVKAAIDGLVDAGVIDGDGPEHVAEIRFRPPQRAMGAGDVGLLLELEP
jgi:crossover junction endodeoxyribonuclease RusA